ncbi:hypothetical protein NFI96_030920 [Prochilodus magdalenae]|nr:hypothetical protein NFI96_030920 [Prochilodus magdalenae]
MGERVTLTCEIESGDYWNYEWYKNNNLLSDAKRKEYEISNVGQYHAGVYTYGDVILDSPVHPVTEGDSLTLRCLYRSTKPSILTADFYRDGSLLQTQTTGEMIIHTVSKSDAGLYHCTHHKEIKESHQRAVFISPVQSCRFWMGTGVDCRSGSDTEFNRIPHYHTSVIYYCRKRTETNPGKVEYQCVATKGLGYKEISYAVKIAVRGRPTPTVKVQPADHVLMGERVTLTCEIESGDDWNYEWYKDNNLLSDAKRKEYEISNVGQYHAGVYTCKGTQSTGRIYTSAAVTLTVSGELKVTPTITSGYEGAVLTGNTVNLYCTLPQSAGWTFYWSKHTQSPEKKTITNIYTISSVRVSDGGQYRCRAGRGNPVYYTHYSDALWVNVTGDVGNCDCLTESNKAMVNIKPDKQVFKGELVTLRCDIQAGGDTEWTYSWYKDDGLYPNRRTQEFPISSVTESNTGKYTCRGERTNNLQKSEISDAVTLTVSDVAQAVLSVSPQSWLTEGDSVTLSCEVTGSSTGWTFSWYRAVPYRQGLKQIRDAHGTSPPASLIISPSRSQHFSGHSLSLSCEGQSDSTGWRVRRYTHSGEVSDCSSVTGSTCSISSLYTSHTGVYWCQSESGGGSDPLNITVHSESTLFTDRNSYRVLYNVSTVWRKRMKSFPSLAQCQSQSAQQFNGSVSIFASVHRAGGEMLQSWS